MSKKDAKADTKEEPKVEKKIKVVSEEDLEKAKPSYKRTARKNRFKGKLESLVQEFTNILVIGIDNVGSNQMQKVRIALRGRAVMLIGKNTMIRKFVRDAATSNSKLENLIPIIKGNVGLVFTNQDLNAIRKTITENKVPAAAKAGSFAPADVFIPPGPTGLDPGQTSFFQALSIPTKINKSAIEITNEVHLIKKGDKITSSAVALLTKLNIKPFFFGITVNHVYEDGSTYGASVLDLSQDDLLKSFFSGVRFAAALGLRVGYPCAATVPHSVATGFKFLVAISLATEYTFEQSKAFKEYLANPDAFKSAAAAPAADAGKGAAPAAAVEEAPAEEEDDVGGFGDLFG